jgi:hypothetical protein
MGDCLLRAVILKMKEIAFIFGLFFRGEGYALILTKNVGFNLGDFFTNSSGHPWQQCFLRRKPNTCQPNAS